MYKVTMYDRAQYPNNGQVLLDTSSGTNMGVMKATLDTKLNEAGSFTFSIAHFHPLYDNEIMTPLRGYVSVEEDGDEIFWGRIIAVQKSPLIGSKQFDCEGAFSFFLDAELGKSTSEINESAEAYFRRCVNEYNTQIGEDAARKILPGTVNIAKKAQTHKYKGANEGEYTQVQSELKNKLIDCNNGFIKIRRGTDTNKTHYIDWFASSSGERQPNPQPVEITRNVVNQTSKESGEDIFTLVRAVGAKVGDNQIELSPQVISNDMLTQYGRIIRTITFGEATTTAALQTELNEYMNMIRDRLSLSGDISFVDFHFLDGTVTSIRCGDIFTGITGYVGKNMIADTVSRDLLNPANDKLTITSEKDLLGKLNSIGANSGSGGGGSGGGGSSGYGRSLSGGTSKTFNDFKETNNVLAIRTQTVEGKWTRYEGTGVYQHEDAIAQVAGNFETGLADGHSYIKLVSGTEFYISPTGVNSNVGTLVYEHDGLTQNVGELILKYEGSYAYQHNDEIGQIVGTYTVNTSLDAEHPYVAIQRPSDQQLPFINPSMQGYYEKNPSGHGSLTDIYVKSTDVTYDTNKTYYRQNYVVNNVTIDAGGGFKFKKNGAAVGVWDKDELSAGMFVEKNENNHKTYTHLKGDYIKLGNESKAQNLTSVITADASTVWFKSGAQILFGTADGETRVTVQNGELTAYSGVCIASGASLKFSSGSEDPDVASSFDLNYNLATKLLRDVAIVGSGNEYKLLALSVSAQTYVDTPTYDVDTGWSQKGTFSRAITRWVGGWSNGTKFWEDGVFKAVAKPQDQFITTTLSALTANGDAYLSNGIIDSNTGEYVQRDNGKYVVRKFDVEYEGTLEDETIPTGFSQQIILDATGVYQNGKNDGWDIAEGLADLQSDSANSQITIKRPKRIQSGSTITRTQTTTILTIHDVNNDSVGLGVFDDNTDSWNNYITYSHGKYTAGWGAAHGKIDLPVGTTSGGSGLTATATFKLPKSTVNNKQDTRSYTIQTKDNNSVELVYNQASSSDVAYVAVFNHGKYNAGFNSVAAPTVTFPSLASSIAAINTGSAYISNKTDGTTRQTAIAITADATKSYSTTSHQMHKCVELTCNGACFGRIDVNDIYQDGHDAGGVTAYVGGVESPISSNGSYTFKGMYTDHNGSAQESGHNLPITVSVPNRISKGSWNNGDLTLRVTSTGSSTSTISLHAGDTEWSGNTATVEIFDGDSGIASNSTGWSVTVNASPRYKDGQDSVGVAYNAAYTPSGSSTSVKAVVPSVGGAAYVPISLSVGTLNTTTGKRTVRARAGSVNVTSSTLSDYANGYANGGKTAKVSGSNSITSNGTYTYKGTYVDLSGNDQDSNHNLTVTVNVPSSTVTWPSAVPNTATISASFTAGGTTKSYTISIGDFPDERGNTVNAIKLTNSNDGVVAAYNINPLLTAQWQAGENNIKNAGGEYTVNFTGDRTINQYVTTIHSTAGGSHNPEIRSTEIWTQDYVPSGAIKADTLNSRYIQAKNDSEYVCFRVRCGDSTATYYMEP